MASAADQAEQRIHEQRRLIEQKLARLETRVKDDISTAQATTRERTQDVTHSIPGRQRIEQQVEQRPLTTLAAGLAAGMALGMLSESISLGGDGSSSRGRYERPSTSGGSTGGGGAGMMSQLIGPATAALIGPVQSQLQEFVSSALSGLSGNGQRSETEAERQEAAGQLARSAQRRQEVAAGAASGDSSN